jgi:hypothetical protein
MKKYTFFVLALCSYFCFFAQEEYDTHGGEPFEFNFGYIPEMAHQDNVYNNGMCYQRIGRFSDEDYFDVECINGVLVAAPTAIKNIIINLLYPPKNKAALPKRLLLVGKPGTGKTTLAKAIAVKCGYDYYVVEAPFLLNEYKNSGPQNLLREIYPLLESGRKVVVILDELTELTDRYKKENDSDATVAAALWILLDSCAQYENVFFIGTSNKEKKDLPAQLQSRFDEDIITLSVPNVAARKRMLEHFLKHEQHKIDAAFLQYLIKKTDGRSAREIEKLVCKAIQFANVRTPQRYTVMCKDFEKALALWKPLYHPVVMYEKIEPHIQPFFKTAFPIILQTVGLIHSIYTSTWQQKNSDYSLGLQVLSYLSQQVGLSYQKDGLDCQKEAFEFQKTAHQESYALQQVSLGASQKQLLLQAAQAVSHGKPKNTDWY